MSDVTEYKNWDMDVGASFCTLPLASDIGVYAVQLADQKLMLIAVGMMVDVGCG